ncbi:hypothetical protein [Anaerobaca lacustris]|uniref:LPXTG cell wall anchor domain-containing protein n=1 Tax=Anaerobaca lacustris TaxID=3044600 RepID=A0AAW6TWP9_9BACT|nr:hypothetical protein [Sedimentisphaerales bacterium M17dextr]
MGWTLEDIQKGAADISAIIGHGMDAIDKVTGKTSTSTGGIAEQPVTPQTTAQPQGTTQADSAGANLLFLGAAIVLLILLFRR